ncbi:hypothetical protein R6Q57_020439 [Mikania cordata]
MSLTLYPRECVFMFVSVKLLQHLYSPTPLLPDSHSSTPFLSPNPKIPIKLSDSNMPIDKQPATPPMIGKIGPYTVFVTPPPTPKPQFESSPPIHPPPVLPPPVQYEKSASAYDSKFGFFWDAVAKVQNGIV